MKQTDHFDDSIRSSLTDVGRSQWRMILTILIFGVVLGANVGWRSAALWAAAAIAAALWTYGAKRSTTERGAPPGLNLVASVAAVSLVWTAAAVLYWMTGDPGLRIMSMLTLTSLLIMAQSASYDSRLIVVAFGAIPAVALVAMPVVLGDFSLLVRCSIGLSLVVMLAHLVIEMQRNEGNAVALRAAQDRAVAANQAKSSFLAMMSHELRTPMNGVLGMAHALTLTRLDRQQASHVDMLIRSGRGLMTILNDLLDISKIEAGKMELETIDFDLPELGRHVHDLWSEAASAKGVSLVYELAPGVPRWVSGDPTRLRQVMLNLVSNALKFTQEGEVRLSIRAQCIDDMADLEISVSDTGLGLSEAQQAKLFKSFVQADASTSRQFGGTGLGLAISQQLVTLMGGEIDLESAPGEGSTFRIKLRAPLGKPGAAEEAHVEMTDLAGHRVLVADDNAINQAVARAILEAAGATIVTAGTGLEALERLRAGAFDTVLMDIHMPVMGGIEALRHIRSGDAGRRDIPVIALTADAMAEATASLLAHGFDRVAPKPIDPAALIWTISELGALKAKAA